MSVNIEVLKKHALLRTDTSIHSTSDSATDHTKRKHTLRITLRDVPCTNLNVDGLQLEVWQNFAKASFVSLLGLF